MFFFQFKKTTGVQEESFLHQILVNGKELISNLWEEEEDGGHLERTKEISNDTVLDRDTPGQIVSFYNHFQFV